MTRRYVAAAATVLLAVSLGACGTARSGSQADASASVRQLNAATFGHEIAAAQITATSAHLEGTVTTAGTKLKMSGNIAVGASIDDLAMAVTVRGGQGRVVSLVFTHRSFFVKVSGVALTHDAARPWIRFDLSDPSNPFGAMFKQLLSHLDPEHVARIYASITKLSDLGIEKVNGVPARHYSVTLDTVKAISAMGMDKLPGVTLQQIKAQLPATLTSQVWLDSYQRMVKTSSEIKGTSTVLTYSDWGKPVSVHAPPANQVSALNAGGH